MIIKQKYNNLLVIAIMSFLLINGTSFISITNANEKGREEKTGIQNNTSFITTGDQLPTKKNIPGIDQIERSIKYDDDYEISDRLLKIKDRDIKATIYESNDHVKIQLDGENEALDLDFFEIMKQLEYSSDRQISGIQINSAPGTIIENDHTTYDGVNITLIDSPNSIIRNNTIKNIYSNDLFTLAIGITLQNSSNTLIYNNTITNIKHEISSDSAAAYGILIVQSNETVIDSNSISLINATNTGGFAGTVGIFFTSPGAIEDITIRDNVLADLYASGSQASYLLYIGGSATNFANLIISGNSCSNIEIYTYTFVYGIFIPMGVAQLNNTLIHDNSFSLNAIANDTYFIYLGADLQENVTITDNERLDNTKSNYTSYGIAIEATIQVKNLYITGNNIEGNAVYCTSSTPLCTSSIDAETYGVYVSSETISNVTILSNTINDNSVNSVSTGSIESYAFYFDANVISQIRLSGNHIVNNSASGPTAKSYAFYLKGDATDVTIEDNIWDDTSAHSFSGNAWTYGIYFYYLLMTNITNVIISNNLITDSSVSSTSGMAGSYSIFLFSGNLITNISIISNTITDSSVLASGNGYSQSIFLIADDSTINNTTIAGNTFTDTRVLAGGNGESYNFYFYAYTIMTNTNINNNIFANSSMSVGGNGDSYSIYLETDSSIKNTTIFGNTFADSSVFAGGTAHAYSFYLYSPSLISNISIFDQVFSDSSVIASEKGYSYSIYLSSSNSLTNITIFNNIFTDSSVVATGNVYSYSIYLSSSNSITNATIFSNTFSDSSISAGGDGYSTSFYCNGPLTTNINIYNNIFVNSSASTEGDANVKGSGLWASISLTNITIFDNSFLNSSTTSNGSQAVTEGFVVSGTSLIYIKIYNNIFADCSATANNGIAITEGVTTGGGGPNKFISIVDNTFDNLVALSDSASYVEGIAIGYGVNNTISSNTFGNITSYSINGDAWTSGITLGNIYNTTIENNNFEYISSYAPNDNSYAYGIYIETGGNYSINNNIIQYISAVDELHEIYLSNAYDVEIGVEAGYGMDVTWIDPTLTIPINGSYTVFIDHSNETYGFWNASIMIPLIIADLPIGTHNITIFISNSTHSVTETIWVIVSDTIDPKFSSSQSVTYEQGDTGNEISWTFTDLFPDTYSILHNDAELVISDNSWTSGQLITLNVDGLGTGTHNFTIIIIDGSGNEITVTLYVIVTDTTKPVVTGSADLTYEQGSTGQTIEWSGEDFNPDTCTLYIDGVEQDPVPWTSGELVIIDVDEYGVGTYNLTMTFIDKSGNSFSDTIIVIVEDTTAPAITSPQDITFQQGTTGNTLTWEITDINDGTYVVYTNDTQISQDSWSSGDLIELNVDDLLVGNYKFTIVVTDDYGNSISDNVIVSVTKGPVDADKDDDGTDPVVIGIIVVATVAILSGGGYVVIRRRRR